MDVDLAELIATSHAAWMPRVVEAVLGTSDPTEIADTLTAAVEAALDAEVVDAVFYEPGVGIVAGFALADGREVVAKAHRGDWIRKERLEAIVRVQADVGGAAPRPLAGPLALGSGWLTIEELRAGETADGYDPVVRRSMATALHAFVEAARPHAATGWIGTFMGERDIDDLWPNPHDLRFDLPGTAPGAEWIDEAARAARDRLDSTALPPIVGHLDWRVQNLAFAGTEVAAIYDWDSLGLVPEPALVGTASTIHPIDWRDHGDDPLPTLEQVDGFVADYEAARGAPFDDEERALLHAGQRWMVAFGARCQHSDDVLGLLPGRNDALGWPRLLHELLDRQGEVG